MPPLRLRPVAHGEQGQERLFTGPRVRIGRSRDNDFVLPDRIHPSSSGHHAEAQLNPDGSWLIVDAGSANGTWVNGVPVQRQRLKTGDRLGFGDELFIVGIDGASGRPRTGIVVAAVALALLVVALVGFAVSRRNTPITFESAAESAAPSVFMIAIDADGQRSMVGSGFAVTDDGWLATNAHIVDALMKRKTLQAEEKGARAVAVQGDNYTAYPIVGARIDELWKSGSLAHDIALVRLKGTTVTKPLRLADAAMIAQLARGTPIAAFGFPAVSTDAIRPRGRLSVDVVGDIRGDYLEVGLGISPGMSGSPVIDRSGSVVAMVAGGDFVEMPDGTARPSGSSANWALSATPIRTLLDTLP